jgi:hypothetical protein
VDSFLALIEEILEAMGVIPYSIPKARPDQIVPVNNCVEDLVATIKDLKV